MLIVAGVLGYHWPNGGQPLSAVETAISPGDFPAGSSGVKTSIYIDKPDFKRDLPVWGNEIRHTDFRESQDVQLLIGSGETSENEGESGDSAGTSSPEDTEENGRVPQSKNSPSL